MTFDGFPRIICSIRVGIDAGTEMHEGKLPTRDCRRRARVIGKRPSYAPGLLCRLRGLSLPAPDPAAITFRPPARKPWFGTLLAVWCRAPGVVPKTYDVFDPKSSEKVIATLSALTYPPAPRRHEASKWQS